jgi:hypothetical protein
MERAQVDQGIGPRSALKQKIRQSLPGFLPRVATISARCWQQINNWHF